MWKGPQALALWRLRHNTGDVCYWPSTAASADDCRDDLRVLRPRLRLGGGQILPSRPGEFHPESLTDPDVILSHHPARVITPRLPPFAEPSGSSRFDPVGPCSTAMTHPLRSTGITPLHNYYEAVHPSPAHRYFGPRGWSRLRLFP